MIYKQKKHIGRQLGLKCQVTLPSMLWCKGNNKSSKHIKIWKKKQITKKEMLIFSMSQ